MTYATSFKGLLFLVPVSLASSGCVVSCHSGYDDGRHCDQYGYCCDEYGCYQQDDDGHHGGSPNVGGAPTTSTTGGFGGAGSGGDATGGSSAEGGASPGCDSTQIVCACLTAEDCSPAGLDCLDSQCLDACEFDYQCAEGKVCGDGRCVPTCDVDAPCDVGYACIGGGCLIDPFNPACLTSADCAGDPCVNGLCTTTCDSNAACAVGYLCDAATGTCFADPSTQPACDPTANPCTGTGQACATDGFCHYGCQTVDECKLIDARYDACDRGVCKTNTELDPNCTFESPCPGGEHCVSNECILPV